METINGVLQNVSSIETVVGDADLISSDGSVSITGLPATEQVDIKVVGSVVTPKATASVYGVTRLSDDPAVPATPIALGTNNANWAALIGGGDTNLHKHDALNKTGLTHCYADSHLLPTTNNAYDLGEETTPLAWRSIYLVGAITGISAGLTFHDKAAAGFYFTVPTGLMTGPEVYLNDPDDATNWLYLGNAGGGGLSTVQGKKGLQVLGGTGAMSIGTDGDLTIQATGVAHSVDIQSAADHVNSYSYLTEYHEFQENEATGGAHDVFAWDFKTSVAMTRAGSRMVRIYNDTALVASMDKDGYWVHPGAKPAGSYSVTIPDKDAVSAYSYLVESNQVDLVASDIVPTLGKFKFHVAQTAVRIASPACYWSIENGATKVLCTSRFLGTDVVDMFNSAWYIASNILYGPACSMTPDFIAPAGASGYHYSMFGTGTVLHSSPVVDGATAVGFRFNSLNALTTAGAILANFTSGTAVKLTINKDGGLVSYGPLQTYMATADNVFKSNTTDGAAATAWTFDTLNTFGTGGDALFRINNNGVNRFLLERTGTLTVSANLLCGGVQLTGSSTGIYVQGSVLTTIDHQRNQAMKILNSGLADGASVIAHQFQTTNAITGATARLFSICNVNVEKAGFDKDGYYYVQGTRVVGARDTGWAADSGTADKGAHATYTAPDISPVPTEAEVQAIADALQEATQEIKALKDLALAHGLAGA